jgi:hypothetical protein
MRSELLCARAVAGSLLTLNLIVGSIAVYSDTSSVVQNPVQESGGAKTVGQISPAILKCTRAMSSSQDEMANVARYREANARVRRVSVFMRNAITEIGSVWGFFLKKVT